MQKKLIALAVAGALAAPLAAHADTTIYGKMHISIDNIDSDTDIDNDSATSISSNSSRIGFKGSEDLGGGLKAVWQAEGTVDLAGTKSNMFNRNSFLGLAGGFGTVIAGRHDTPYKTVGRKVDLFGDTIGDFRSVTDAQSGNDARTNNTIAYITPDMNGLSAVLAYVTDIRASVPAADGGNDGTNENNDFDAYSASINYANGPLFAALALQSISADAFGANADDQEAMRIAASYKMAGIKLNAMYFDETANGGVDGDDRDGFLVGAAYGMGNNTFKIQYITAEGEDDETGTSKVAVGFDHAMSKATSVYAAYAMADNDDTVRYNVVGAGHGDRGPDDLTTGETAVGESPSAFSIGMIHKF